MKNLKELAEVLKSAGTVIVPKASIHDKVQAMADDIYKCPVRNSKKRTPEQVYRDCSFVAIEYALAQVIDGQLNPLPFDIRNPESYKFDVIKDGQLYETKRHKIGAKYFTYNKKSLKTYIKHCIELDYLVTAYLDDVGEDYKVSFAMVCDSKTFEYYFQPSKFKGDDYYDHILAQRHGHCVPFGLRNSYY